MSSTTALTDRRAARSDLRGFDTMAQASWHLSIALRAAAYFASVITCATLDKDLAVHLHGLQLLKFTHYVGFYSVAHDRHE